MLRKFTTVALLLAAAMPDTAAAQEASPGGQKLAVTAFRVLPADAARFETGVEDLVAAMQEINGRFGWWYWNNGFDYTLVYPFENMAYWDDPGQWFRQFQGTSVEERMNELYGETSPPSMETTASEILENVPNWSHLLDVAAASEQFAFVQVTDIWLKTGEEMEWEEVIKDWVSLLGDAEYPYPMIGYRCMFGCGFDARLVTLHNSRVDYYGINALDRLVEAKGLSTTRDAILDRYVSIATRQLNTQSEAKPDMGYRVVP